MPLRMRRASGTASQTTTWRCPVSTTWPTEVPNYKGLPDLAGQAVQNTVDGRPDRQQIHLGLGGRHGGLGRCDPRPALRRSPGCGLSISTPYWALVVFNCNWACCKADWASTMVASETSPLPQRLQSRPSIATATATLACSIASFALCCSSSRGSDSSRASDATCPLCGGLLLFEVRSGNCRVQLDDRLLGLECAYPAGPADRQPAPRPRPSGLPRPWGMPRNAPTGHRFADRPLLGRLDTYRHARFLVLGRRFLRCAMSANVSAAGLRPAEATQRRAVDGWHALRNEGRGPRACPRPSFLKGAPPNYQTCSFACANPVTFPQDNYLPTLPLCPPQRPTP